MVQAAPPVRRDAYPRTSPVPPNGIRCRGYVVQNPARNGASYHRVNRALRVPRAPRVEVGEGRRRMARLLWLAFPGRSEAAVAERAAPHLGVSPRTVRSWLREEHDPPYDAALRLVPILGVGAVFAAPGSTPASGSSPGEGEVRS